MRFPPTFIDELKTRLSISEIVGRRVALKHSSRGEFTGLCPFHTEKTPSFTVSEEKGFYHCFGCSAHGNAINFVMETQGFSFFDAVKNLAEDAGMQLPQEDPQEIEKYEKITTLYDVVESACLWFEKQLPKNHDASHYLQDRGVNTKTIKTFRLGYAPADGLKKAMLKDGYTEKQLEDAGLIVTKKTSYDRFRNRIIFPIMDLKDRVIAFGGRIIDDGQPKYLNSPETDLFHKGSILYGFNLARQKAYDKSAIVIVEGYMDVIALHMAGITNAVAPLGTSLTESHVKTLWKIAREPVICMDGDSAGKRAMTRAAENYLPILEAGNSLRFAILPSRCDPDDMIKKHGINSMREILTAAIPLSEILWNTTLSGNTLSTPERKAEFEKKLMKLVDTIKNKTVQTHYRRHFKSKLWNMNIFGKKGVQQKVSPQIKRSMKQIISKKDQYKTTLVLIAIKHPSILEHTEIEEFFAQMEIADNKLNDLRNAIVDIGYTNNLASALEKQGYSTYIDTLAQNKFVDSGIKNVSNTNTAKALWQYISALYELASLEEEYQKTSEMMTENVTDVVYELKKQKDMLKESVDKKRAAYEMVISG